MEEEDQKRAPTDGSWRRALISAAALFGAGVVGGLIGASVAPRVPKGSVETVRSIVQVVRPQPSQDDFADVLDAKCSAIVSVVPSSSSPPSPGDEPAPVAAGVLISTDGQVLTSSRSLPSGNSLTVRLGDGRRFDAKRGSSDTIAGLTLLKVDGTNLPALQFAEPAASRTGSVGALVATPNGRGCTAVPAMVGSDFLASGGGQRATVRLQPLPANVLPGTPFLAQDGSLAALAGLYTDAGEILPGSIAGQIASKLLRGDADSAGVFGFEAQDVMPDLAVRLGDGRLRGAMVDLVQPGTPADAAGLIAGDIIVEANGTPVSNASELGRVLASESSLVELQVRRKPDAPTLTIKIANPTSPSKRSSQ